MTTTTTTTTTKTTTKQQQQQQTNTIYGHGGTRLETSVTSETAATISTAFGFFSILPRE